MRKSELWASVMVHDIDWKVQHVGNESNWSSKTRKANI